MLKVLGECADNGIYVRFVFDEEDNALYYERYWYGLGTDDYELIERRRFVAVLPDIKLADVDSKDKEILKTVFDKIVTRAYPTVIQMEILQKILEDSVSCRALLKSCNKDCLCPLMRCFICIEFIDREINEKDIKFIPSNKLKENYLVKGLVKVLADDYGEEIRMILEEEAKKGDREY